MELLNIGRHCSNTDCNQLDYLPFKCQHCRNYYCGEHSKPKQHSCINLPPTDDGERVPICPICDIPVPISRGENPNVRTSGKTSRTNSSGSIIL
ncbi:2155_t:CDS:2 [Diversispora eburnea]|uniref:2155_t:CDS:1 n=1 Tax=Diversispora eburnea TaxID=1213867 RepID=A0A9N9C920_9GLOM|nr:2155_t:CDS:2 [Diversispora eburnea]